MISHFDVTVMYMYTLILSESLEIIYSYVKLTKATKFRSIGLQAIQNYNMHIGAIPVHHVIKHIPAFPSINALKS